MLLLVQLQYAKDAHSVPIPPPTEQKTYKYKKPESREYRTCGSCSVF